MSLVLMTVGYAMLYSVLHGSWEFWTYFFPKKKGSKKKGSTTSTPPVSAQ